MAALDIIAPAFVEMAHRIVWATVATVEPSGQPRTRILHPIWEWNGERLVGWIATGPDTPKARHLDADPRVSVTYWDPTHDTCTADCHTTWLASRDDKAATWERFLTAPAPVGYDPAIVPGWDSPSSSAFGVLELRPTRLRVFPGTVLLRGEGTVLSWTRPRPDRS